MRHLVTFLLATVMAVADAMALSPRTAFVSAPRDVLVSVDSVTRLDMLDYYDSGSTIGSRNRLGGTSQVKLVTDNAITVSTSGSSDVTIALLPVGSDTTILVINTIALPATNSTATLYDRNWKMLAPKLQLPSHNDLGAWLLPQYEGERKELENLLPFITAVYSYKDGTLSMTHTLGKVLGPDDYKSVKTKLRPTLAYQWTGKKWVQKP